MPPYRKWLRPHKDAPKTRTLNAGVAVPAATTLVAVLIGAALNSLEARRLERQKFEFDVLKFTLTASPSPARRLRMLCDFADLGLVDDVDGRYRRAEIGGQRPCGTVHDNQAFYPADALIELRRQVGDAPGQGGQPTFERGILKFDGRVGDARTVKNNTTREWPVRRILVGYIRSSLAEWSDEAIRSNGDAIASQLIVQRDGTAVQASNIFSGETGTVRIGLVNSGQLRFETEGRGPTFQLKDVSGATVPRDSGVGFRHVGDETVGRQRFADPQIKGAERLLSALCSRWPAAKLRVTTYVSETLRMQGEAAGLRSCASEAGADPSLPVSPAGSVRPAARAPNIQR